MVRRVVVDDAVDQVAETRVVEHRSPAETIASILTVLYSALVALIGLDALLEALDAREENGFVSAIDALSGVFVRPFDGVFNDQRYWATALIAIVVYTIVYLIAMAALQRDRTVI
ncbi:MAG TPA: hypothetical protein VNA12_00685 [Mycobacteriales bacterium]|nr:hypothetical protein [Mycobacteriales bacterium]